MNEPEVIEAMLGCSRPGPHTVAVVGLSDSPLKPSFYVSEYMQQQGFRILPVNPLLCDPPRMVLGERAYPSLTALVVAQGKPDIVNVFRLPRFIPAIVDEMIALGLPALWVQQSLMHEDAAARAEAAGIRVVMDRCILVEHRRRCR